MDEIADHFFMTCNRGHDTPVLGGLVSAWAWVVGCLAIPLVVICLLPMYLTGLLNRE